MKLPIETWLESQELDQEAGSCFSESFICFKVGAYKAALLFAYLGFLGVLRTRILAAQTPNGFVAANWLLIQNNVRKAETWDKSVYDVTQQQQPGQIFVVAPDLRGQVTFWKDRRNDCAHSKQNKIVAAHVEAFYSFVESNLSKFAVNGSRPAITARILNYYNPSLTPPNHPIAPLIQDIAHAVPNAELNDFATELATQFDNRRSATEILLNQQSANKLNFISKCFQYGTQELRSAWLNYLTANIPCLVSVLRVYPADVYVLAGRAVVIRQLWHDHLFSDSLNDFAILAALLRHNLIPAGEVDEAMRHIAEKSNGHIPTDFDTITLRQAGFFNAFESVVIQPNRMGNFEWANTTKALIVKHLADAPITRNAAVAISQTFSNAFHPWHLRAYLNDFFQNNPAKKQEYEAYLEGEPLVVRPEHIPALGLPPQAAVAAAPQ